MTRVDMREVVIAVECFEFYFVPCDHVSSIVTFTPRYDHINSVIDDSNGFRIGWFDGGNDGDLV